MFIFSSVYEICELNMHGNTRTHKYGLFALSFDPDCWFLKKNLHLAIAVTIKLMPENRGR